MKKSISFILIIVSLCSTAQNQKGEKQILDGYSDSLRIICGKIYSSKTDIDKKKFNQQLLKTFELALNTDFSFTYPFDSLTDIARLVSPDNTFRIINWNIPYSDGTQEYFGFIQNKHVQVKKKGLFRKERIETLQLYSLIDKSLEIKNPENVITDNKKWFGMLYYKIIPIKTKKQTYYTLLGWDGNDKFTSKKIIDVLTFDDKGLPHFGADIFNIPKKNPKRVIFEYAASCTMSLKYNAKKDSIVFDHLAPEQPQLEGQYQYYCTDMSYDGFGFKRGKWNYGADVSATNEKDNNDKYYNDPRNTKQTHESNNFILKDKKKKK
ncbi:MAG: hypothetical protein V4608_01230 [Bacteroidota bacterium]